MRGRSSAKHVCWAIAVQLQIRECDHTCVSMCQHTCVVASIFLKIVRRLSCQLSNEQRPSRSAKGVRSLPGKFEQRGPELHLLLGINRSRYFGIFFDWGCEGEVFCSAIPIHIEGIRGASKDTICEVVLNVLRNRRKPVTEP